MQPGKSSLISIVTASDTAFGLFLLRNYKDIKKPVWGQREQGDSSTKN